jgi:hypothetical protein
MEKLKLLMDYTIFHVGVYITLSTLLISLLGLKGFKEHTVLLRPYLVWTLGCFIVAGALGGLIAGSLPYYENFSELQEAKLGPWFLPGIIPFRWCANLEHTAFWLGIVGILLGLVRTNRKTYPW